MTAQTKSFTFVVSWLLWLVMLSVFSKTRIGYVLLYYSLLLMILFVLVTEYKNLAPFITGIQSIQEFNHTQDTKIAVPLNKGTTTQTIG